MTDGLPPMDEPFSLPVNDVLRKTVPENDIERGFEYFEQELTDTAEAKDTWSELISGLVARVPEKSWILGIVTNGKLRWSADVPRHSSLMGEDKRNSPEVRISLQIKDTPVAEDTRKEATILVEGNDKFTEEIGRTANYLQRNIPSFSEQKLIVYNYGEDNPRTSLYNGNLGEYK